jgi:MoaA/NifB/PqqE/SkfB family radical SAM enzyme
MDKLLADKVKFDSSLTRSITDEDISYVTENICQNPFFPSEKMLTELGISLEQLILIYETIQFEEKFHSTIFKNSLFHTSFQILKFILSHPHFFKKVLANKCYSPLIVEFHARGPCNNNCIHCYNKQRGYAYSLNNALTKDNYLRIIDELTASDVKYINFSGGLEPLTDRAMFPSILKSIDQGFQSTIYTTGLYITKNKLPYLINLHRIRISLYGTNADEYQQFTRCKNKEVFTIITKNIQDLMAFKKAKGGEVRVSICMMILPNNYKKMLAMTKLAAQLQIDAIEFRTEFCNQEHLFSKDMISNVKNIVEQLKLNKNKGMYGDLELDFGEGFYFLNNPELLEAQQIILRKNINLCFSSFVKIGIDPWGYIFPCALTTQPGVNLNDLGRFMIESIQGQPKFSLLEKYNNFISRSPMGFEVEKCKDKMIQCNVFEGNINAWLGKFYNDKKVGIELEQQPFYCMKT